MFGIEYKKNINIEKVLFLKLFEYDINLKPHKIPDNIDNLVIFKIKKFDIKNNFFINFHIIRTLWYHIIKKKLINIIKFKGISSFPLNQLLSFFNIKEIFQK